jgi:hypothetical protein
MLKEKNPPDAPELRNPSSCEAHLCASSMHPNLRYLKYKIAELDQA